jgi:hypothetical protein
MDKLFCPKCGNATLAKLGVTLRSNGVPEYHYRRGRKANIRGTKFPLPKPKVRRLCALSRHAAVWVCVSRRRGTRV